jgi:hypothetical protein
MKKASGRGQQFSGSLDELSGAESDEIGQQRQRGGGAKKRDETVQRH